MTNQEAFNRVVTHLRLQGRQSVDPNHPYQCLYRSPEGLKCAVGVFLTDEFYEPWMDEQTYGTYEERASYFRKLSAVIANAAPGVEKGLLIQLQKIHDTLPIREWEDAWSALAREYHLQMPVRQDQAVCA